MPQFLKFVIVLVVLVGIGWFSNYAFHEVDKSEGVELRKENKNLQAMVDHRAEQLKSVREQQKADLAKKQEALLALFPNEAERINALFSPVAEKTEEGKKATEPAAVKGGH